LPVHADVPLQLCIVSVVVGKRGYVLLDILLSFFLFVSLSDF